MHASLFIFDLFFFFTALPASEVHRFRVFDGLIMFLLLVPAYSSAIRPHFAKERQSV